MATYGRTTSNMDHAENFIDLDDLDLAGIELTSGEMVAGGVLTNPCTAMTKLCSYSDGCTPY